MGLVSAVLVYYTTYFVSSYPGNNGSLIFFSIYEIHRIMRLVSIYIDYNITLDAMSLKTFSGFTTSITRPGGMHSHVVIAPAGDGYIYMHSMYRCDNIIIFKPCTFHTTCETLFAHLSFYFVSKLDTRFVVFQNLRIINLCECDQ